jgi:hypothetical protein
MVYRVRLWFIFVPTNDQLFPLCRCHFFFSPADFSLAFLSGTCACRPCTLSSIRGCRARAFHWGASVLRGQERSLPRPAGPTELGGVMRAAGVREGPSTISTECYALHDLHCCWNIGSTPGSSAHSCGVARSEHRPFCAQLWFCWICTSDLLRCWFVIWLCSDPI